MPSSSQLQVSQTSNNSNKNLLLANVPINLPEGPPTRSPLPIGNWNSDPNSANCSFSFNPINPVGIVPIRPPVREAVIKNNPSARKCRSAPNSPLRRRHLKTASPLIGVSSLGVLDKQISNSSLDWDGLTNTPSFYRRPSPIPVLSTPSTSLDSIPINSPMPGASSPFNTPGNHHNLNMAPSGQDQLKADALALRLSKKHVENLIELFPPDGLTAYHLNVCNEKLKEIKDTFRDFSGKVSTFCIKYANVDQMPHLLANQPMTVQWWEEQEKSLLQKVVQHERDIGHAASQLQEQIQAGISDSQKESRFNEKESKGV